MTRSALVAAALVVGAVLLAPAPASALPAAKLPTSEALAAAGVKVTWPLRQGTTNATPGQRFAVRVHRGSARTRVRLVRVTAGRGVPIRVVRQRTLRAGTFTATLAATAPATYALQVSAGGRTFHGWIVVPAPVPPAPAPAPTPAPAPKPRTQAELACGRLDGSTIAATLTLAADAPQPVAAGTWLGVDAANTGDVCLVYPNGGPVLQRRTDAGAWEDVVQKTPEGVVLGPPTAELRAWPQGHVHRRTIGIPPDAVPGTYRTALSVQAWEVFLTHTMATPAVGPFLSPTFEVVAKPQPQP